MVKFPPIRRRKMIPMSEAREYRLRRGVPLHVAAAFADVSLNRASEVERHPERARPGELERLRNAVDDAANFEQKP